MITSTCRTNIVTIFCAMTAQRGRKSKLSKIKLLDRHLIDKIAAGSC